MPSYKIFEDDKYLAFLDIYPTTEGHILVIPKQHVEWVWDHPETGDYFAIVSKIARHMRKVSGDVVRSNIDGWQVSHAHIHLKPAKINSLKGEKLANEELAKVQAKYSMI